MSISVTPSIDERVQRLPQQALQQSDTQESPMNVQFDDLGMKLTDCDDTM